jgi:predicted GH43/DUF377 family glycosyl hydrolase
MSVSRSPQNPIITPGDVKPSRDDFEVIGTFNAAATRFDEQVILLLRVAERPVSSHPDIVYAPIYDVEKKQMVLKEFSKDEPANDFSDPRLIVRGSETYLTSISHLKVARSADGTNFEIEQTLGLAAQTEYETFGLEDARISPIDGTYYINYVAVSPAGVTTALASTSDFVNFQRRGIIFSPDNKDVVIFPQKVNGKFYAIHRPASGLFQKNDMWIAESNDLICWGNHRYLMGPSPKGWDCNKIGAGAVPVRVKQGWLEVYHGVDSNQRYCLGAVLLNADKPWKVLARSAEPIFEPVEDYECSGFFGNVVFTCGLLCEQDKLKIYYGAADISICYAELNLYEVLASLKI